MSKRYKGKDTHYRLQIKKDGEWQDLGLVASAEMDNKSENTTATNFDEKYIHRNNDKNDSTKDDDIKTTDLTLQTSTAGRTPKLTFKNNNTNIVDYAELYLDSSTKDGGNKSTLHVVVGDDKGSAEHSDTISFDWKGSDSNQQSYYTFSETSLDASGVTANFSKVRTTEILKANNPVIKFADGETHIYNYRSDHTDSALTIWGNPDSDDSSHEASIQYRNKTLDNSWTVGLNVSNAKDNQFGWFSHRREAGPRMSLTHDGTLNIGKRVSIYSTPNSKHPDEQTNLIVRPNEISFSSHDKLSALSYVNGGANSTDYFKLALGNEGDEPLEFNWVNTSGEIVQNRKGWLQYPGAEKRGTDPQLVWSSELDSRLSSELTARNKDLTFQKNTNHGISWQNETDTAKIYTTGNDNNLSLILQVTDDGNEKIIFRSSKNGNPDTDITVNSGSLIADHDLTAKGNIMLANSNENTKFTMSYNDTDQCVDFIF